VTQANVTVTCVNTKAGRFMIEIDWNCGCKVKSFSAVNAVGNLARRPGFNRVG
jgi:hypothetical protein